MAASRISRPDSTTAVLTSVLVHMAIILALGLLVVARQSERTIELQVSQASNFSEEPITESISIEPAVDVASSSMASLQLVDQEFEFSAIADVATLSLVDGDGGLGLNDDLLMSEVGLAKLDGLSSDFGKRIREALKHGIDIVIVFDSTGSMGVEIDAVKEQISVIGSALIGKLPKAQIALVTYRDRGDDYLVKGTPLTDSLSQLETFLGSVTADGGGNHPEAVSAGLQWALTKCEFRRESSKFVLIFGDAPPHRDGIRRCVSMAREFRHSPWHGRISTITCGAAATAVTSATRRRGFRPTGIPSFIQIARAGGGESYLLKDARKLMEDILVLAFGNKPPKRCA